MGTWGTKPFENDAASDWVYDLLEGTLSDVIVEALDIAQVDYLEAPEGEIAVAACQVVVAVDGDVPPGLPDEVAAWIKQQTEDSAGQYRALSLAALDRVLASDSELLELWSEAGGEDFAAWRTTLEELRNRVRQIPPTADGSAPRSSEGHQAPVQSKRPWWKFWV